MVYPSKIDPQIITASALSLLRREGEGALTLRRLAKELGVTANALYKYYDSLDVLRAAAADAVAQELYAAIDEGMAALPEGTAPVSRLHRLLEIYSSFAENNPDLYRIFLDAKPAAASRLPEPHYHTLMWPQVLAVVEPLVGVEDAPAATVTLWSLLHGIWALRQANVLGGKKPEDITDYAYQAVIRGLATRG
ncbi:TetR/AcrR family transcriptional regulator [Salipiger abyssi]|uniref:TetR/AcrR family transcriptional regulator n=1 Tax=Salipiger abyssi TaxID=1250539 RepID=UPI0009759207|nr:TetR/AcrR family transcriptional regulator [Salipiger abyssi]